MMLASFCFATSGCTESKESQITKLLNEHGWNVSRTKEPRDILINEDILSEGAIRASNRIGLHPEKNMGQSGSIITIEPVENMSDNALFAKGLYDEDGKLIGAWLLEKKSSAPALPLDIIGQPGDS